MSRNNYTFINIPKIFLEKLLYSTKSAIISIPKSTQKNKCSR